MAQANPRNPDETPAPPRTVLPPSLMRLEERIVLDAAALSHTPSDANAQPDAPHDGADPTQSENLSAARADSESDADGHDSGDETKGRPDFARADTRPDPSDAIQKESDAYGEPQVSSMWQSAFDRIHEGITEFVQGAIDAVVRFFNDLANSFRELLNHNNSTLLNNDSGTADGTALTDHTDLDGESSGELQSSEPVDNALPRTDPPVLSALLLPADNMSTITDTNPGNTATGGAGAVIVDGGITVDDGDGGLDTLEGAAVRITNGFVSAEDVLEFDAALATGYGITGAYDATTGELILAGAATAAEYQDVLRTVTYENTSATPDTTARSILFVIGDESDGLSYNAANGHYYKYVGTATNWMGADGISDASTAGGLQGYLATVTSAPEDAFVFGLAGAARPWLGASDAAVEGEWRWVAGPETGVQFWLGDDTGAPVGGMYTNFIAGQPNNAPGEQDYLRLRNDGLWEDRPESEANAYVIEFGGMASDVEGQLAASVKVGVATPSADNVPTITDTNPGNTAAGGGGAVIVDAGIIVNDGDGGTDTLQGAAVRISTGFNAAQDVLAFNSGLATGFGISGSYNASTGELILSGAATAAEYQQVLRTVTYENTSATPDTTARGMLFVIGDDYDGVAYNTANGHYYELDPANVDWLTAEATANASSLGGLQGYLTTITTVGENGAVEAYAAGANFWMGASDATVEGEWRWVSGPESGIQFWQGDDTGTTVGGMYTNWDAGQPSNGGAGDDYAKFRPDGTWNDRPSSATDESMIEYGGLASDSEGQLAASVTVNVVVASDNAPTIADTDPGNTATGSAGAVIVDAGITVSDGDGGTDTLQGAAVRITTGFTTAEDVLTFDAGLATGFGIVGAYDTATGELILSGAATAAEYQQVLRTVAYANISDTPDTTARDILFVIGDDYSGVAFNTANGHYYRLVDTPTNWLAADAAADASTLGGLQGYLTTVTSGAENTFVDNMFSSTGWISGSDDAVEGEWYWVNGPEAGTQFWQGIWTGTPVGGMYTNWDPTFPATPNNFGGSDNYTRMGSDGTWRDLDGPDSNEYVVEYGGMATDAQGQLAASVTVNVAAPPPDNAPTIADTDPGNTATGNGGAVIVDAGVTVDDGDGGADTLDGAAVRIVTAFNAAEDVLAFNSGLATGFGIAGAYNAATGELILSGTATAAEYQQVLRTVTYENTSATPDTTARGMLFVIGDDYNGVSYNAANGHYYTLAGAWTSWTVADTAADARTLGGLQGYLATITSGTENTAVLGATGGVDAWIGAGDVAVEGEWRWVTGPEAGTQFWQGNAAGTPFGGMYANWHAVEPNNAGGVEDHAQIRLTGVWNDTTDIAGSVTEYGGLAADAEGQLAASVTVNVAAPTPDNLPTIADTNPGNTAVGSGGAVVVDAGITVNDGDGGGDTLRGAAVRITTGFVSAEDVLAFDGVLATGFGISGSYNAATGELILAGAASAAQYQQVLRTVTYENTSGTPDTTARSMMFVIGDDALGYAYNQANGHYYEFIDAKSGWNAADAAADASTLGGLQGYLATLTSAGENALMGSIILGGDDPWIGANDVAVEGEWRWVTGPETGVLFWLGDETGAPVGGEYTNWDGGEPDNGGNDDHYARIENADFWRDRQETENNESIVEYGGLASDTEGQLAASVVVNVLDPNDAPVLDNTGNMSLAAVDEGDTNNGGTTVADIITSAGGNRITDADGDPEGFAITAIDNTNGTWQYSISGGAIWLDIGAVANNNALLLRDTDLVRFQPSGDWNGTVAAGITFRAWDRDTGFQGTYVDTTTNGDPTAFSTATETASIVVNNINDAPVLDNTGTMSLTAIDENETGNSGDTVADIITSAGGNRITDADGDPEGIAILAVDSTNGTWQYSVNGGSNWNDVPAINANSALLLRDSDLVRFQPSGDWNGTVAAGITFRAWDRTSGTAGGLGDTTPPGGMTAFSSDSETASIVVNPINDAPVLDNTGNMSLTAINEGETGNGGTTIADIVTSAGGNRITDVDGVVPEGFAITAIDNTNGTWQFSTNGGGAWTNIGAVANNNALLLRDSDLVRFQPSGDWNGTVAAGITFRAWDQTSGTQGNYVNTTTNGGTTAFSTATETASIVVNNVNDAPLLDNTGNMSLTAVVEGDTGNGGNTIADIVTSAGGNRITDIDGDPEGFAITAIDNTNGTWQFSTNGGGAWTDIGAVANNNALLLRATDLVRFQPAGVWNGTVAAGITFRAWDQSTGTEGNYVNTTTNGGTTPYSTATETASIVVTPINDAPVLDNSSDLTLTAIAEDDVTNVGDKVGTIIASAGGDPITDADGVVPEGIAIIGIDNTNGTWQFSTDGVSWTDIGAVANNNALLLRESDFVRFQPNADWNGTIAAGITFRAWDQSAGTEGTYVTTAINGGNTAFSAATETASLAVNPVNDAPTPAGLLGDQTATQDAVFNYQFAAAAFTDIDGDTITYGALLSDGSPLPGWLSFDASTRTFSGTPTNDDVGDIVVRITADDGNGGTASDTITITVDNINDDPTVTNPLIDQTAAQHAAFNYQFASNAFTDPDVGDTLSYAADLAGGGALPAWLSFDPVTRTFSGTPTNDDLGVLDVRVTADDGNGGVVTDTFTITVDDVNDDPAVVNPLVNQVATEDTNFSYQFASNTFADADAGDTLSYSASLADGNPLPGWLTFDGVNRTFAGTPANGDVGTQSVRVIVDDGNGGTAIDAFTLTINNVNDAPTVANALGSQTAVAGDAFVYQFGSNAFVDIDPGDTLSYTAALSDGSPLPAWLGFNASTRTFSGTPGVGEIGVIDIRVTASDGNGGTTSDVFAISVTEGVDLPADTAPDDNPIDVPTTPTPTADPGVRQDATDTSSSTMDTADTVTGLDDTSDAGDADTGFEADDSSGPTESTTTSALDATANGSSSMGARGEQSDVPYREREVGVILESNQLASQLGGFDSDLDLLTNDSIPNEYRETWNTILGNYPAGNEALSAYMESAFRAVTQAAAFHQSTHESIAMLICELDATEYQDNAIAEELLHEVSKAREAVDDAMRQLETALLAAADAGKGQVFDKVLEDVVSAALQRLIAANENLFVETRVLNSVADIYADIRLGEHTLKARLETATVEARDQAWAEVAEMRASWDRVAQDVFAAFVRQLAAAWNQVASSVR